MTRNETELLTLAAERVVQTACGYGAAKRQAASRLGWDGPLPDDAVVDDAVRTHLALFGPVTQVQDCAALRRLALQWMDRLRVMSAYLTGAVWSGLATRMHPVVLQGVPDDPKALGWQLIDAGLDCRVEAPRPGRLAPLEVWTVAQRTAVPEFATEVVLQAFDAATWRQLPRRDGRGQPIRGNRAALVRLLEDHCG